MLSSGRYSCFREGTSIKTVRDNILNSPTAKFLIHGRKGAEPDGSRIGPQAFSLAYVPPETLTQANNFYFRTAKGIDNTTESVPSTATQTTFQGTLATPADGHKTQHGPA